MKQSKILDGRLWPRLGFEYAPSVNAGFKNNKSHKGHLANQLLLYDKVILPTNDFGIIPIIIDWMGLKTFQDVLESDSLEFVRSNSVLSYAGAGNGISLVRARPSPQKELLWWQEATFGDTDVSIELQLVNTCSQISATLRNQMISTIISKTTDVNVGNKFFVDNVAHETYMDVLGSDRLTKYFLNYYKFEKGELDLQQLPSVGPDKLQISSIGVINDPVDLLLRIAEVNLEFVISNEVGGIDLFTSEDADYLFQNKLKRVGIQQYLVDGFTKLLELNNLPNIELAVINDQIPITKVWEIRQRKESRQFRAWLREVQPSDTRELEKAYVAAISKNDDYSSLPVRVIRFVMLNAIGLVNPIAGLISGGIDSFFLEKISAGYSPKLFFDRLRKLKLGE